MGLEFLGGIANAYGGYKEGADQELARQQLAADRTYTNEQRVLQRGRQDRALKQQGIDDANAESDRALPTQREVDDAPEIPESTAEDGTVTPATPATKKMVDLTPDEMRKSLADNYKKTGRTKDYLAAQGDIDKAGFEKSAREYNQWDASTKSMDPLAKLVQASEFFSNQPHAGKIGNIVQDPETGQISFDAIDGSGRASHRVVNNAEDALRSLSAYYTPAGYQASQAAMAKQAGKENEIRIKGAFDNEGKRITALGQIEGRRITAAARGLGGLGGASSSGDTKEVLAQRKESADSVKRAETFYQNAMLAVQPGMKAEDSEAVKVALAGVQKAKFNHSIVEIKTSANPEQSAAERVLGVAANTADVMKSLNQLHSVFGPSFTDNVGAMVMESDSFKQMAQSEKKDPAAPGQAPQAPAKPGKASAIPWKDRLPHGEQQFANVVSKSGWEPYVEKYGVWGGSAYRKPDGNGGWVIKKASDLAKDLGVQY
jgi:hypothetical protein